MAGFWMNLEDRKAQPRHNIHILDSSILIRLSQIEAVAHPEFGQSKDRKYPVINENGVASRLFEPVLKMCSSGKNVLVIPEAVLREFYHRTRMPLTRNQDHQWTWHFHNLNEITAQQEKLPSIWDDRGHLMSRFIQQAFEQNEIVICDSAEQFSERFSQYAQGKRLAIVGDAMPCGDSAIRCIADAINPLHFRAVSVLSGDRDLRKSLQYILQDHVAADSGVLFDAFAKYSRTSSRDTLSREELNGLMAKAAEHFPSFYDYKVGRLAGGRSDSLLKAMGHYSAIHPESGLSR